MRLKARCRPPNCFKDLDIPLENGLLLPGPGDSDDLDPAAALPERFSRARGAPHPRSGGPTRSHIPDPRGREAKAAPTGRGYLRSALTRRRLVSGAANFCCSRPFVLYIRSDPQRIGDLLTASVAMGY